MANSSVNGLKTLFILLGCIMVVTLIFTIYIDGLPFRKDILTPWMAATLVDFYINVVALAAWVLYRESNWLSAIIWIILLVCFGSITTCAYIVMLFFKLTSSQESIQDPMYCVLLRHPIEYICKTPDKDGMEQKWKQSYVLTLRILFSVLGFLMLGTLIYTLLTDGSPFRQELLTPWMVATLIDFYINVVALSVWVTYKESSWISAIFWIILLICFGSITTCFYIVWKLFQLSSEHPVYLVLSNSGNRKQV
ncbi:uncharacterized protein LOC132183698 isoform X2 [Corylus avellana]|uniref:uncharacterized protein LOC132183698 isoform X2 n=1 Tax=Corylus avellana TaxID=13451 RepID=UPI00286CBE00|nr:uncharacterized protein LOC132183698 isoform X2 [Corylus avellana]